MEGGKKRKVEKQKEGLKGEKGEEGKRKFFPCISP